MIDVLIGVGLALLLVRGWRRGLIHEAIGLVVLVVGTVAALRLSTPVGSFASRLTGTGPDASRVVGAVLVFLIVSIAAALVAGALTKGSHVLPGMPTVNRIGGALLAAGAGALVATLLLSALSVLPLPEAAAGQVDESEVAQTLTDPDGFAQQTLDLATGERFMSVLLRIDDLFDETAIGDPGDGATRLDVPENARIELDESGALRLSILVNEARVAEGATPIARSATLDPVAEATARDLYERGWLTHGPAGGPTLAERLDALDFPRLEEFELLGIGASPSSVVEAWRAAPNSKATLASEAVRRYGVAVANGPAGRLAVLVATG